MKRYGSSISEKQGRTLMNYNLRVDGTSPDTLYAILVSTSELKAAD